MIGQFTTYALYTALHLLIGYLCYKWLMAGEKQMRLNRYTLLGIYLIAFAAYPISSLFNHMAYATLTDGVEVVNIGFDAVEQTSNAVHTNWPSLIVLIYLIGTISVAIWSFFSMCGIIRLINSGHIEKETGNVKIVLLPKGKVAPFGWMNFIVMTQEDYNETGQLIIAHEAAHIAHRHCYDLIIAQIVCILQWFNPAAWLMLEELKAVHEFQADDTVISSGIEPRKYQLLLIKKAVSIRFQSHANSLNHSNLKKRITMMYIKKSSARRKLRVLALVPALGAVLSVCNIPAVASALSATSAVTLNAPSKSTSKVSEIPSDSQNATVDKQDKQDKQEVLPQFPGGEPALLNFLTQNTNYPQEAMDKNIEGVVIVKFTVATNGYVKDIQIIKSVNQLLDDEAIRVFKTMPQWTPGTVDGQPTEVSMVLPVTFKLAKDK